MQKHIKIALIFLIISLPLFFLGLFYNSKKVKLMSRGDYFFSEARESLDVNDLVFTFPDKSSFTLEKDGDFWRVKEADNYYVSLQQSNFLANMIQNTVVYRADPLTTQNLPKDNTKIDILDAKGDIIESVIIYPREKNNTYAYATRNDDGLLYQIKGNFAFSPNFMDWVKMPILQLNYDDLKRIKSANFQVYRRFRGDEFKNVETDTPISFMRGLTVNLWYLMADDIKQEKHFDKTAFPEKTTLELTTLDGVVYILTFYHNDNEYWLNISFETELFAKNTAKTLLEENRLLYDGWFFKINPDKGKLITKFQI
jgi:hypothetical protein